MANFLNVYNNTPVTLLTGGLIPFNQFGKRLGCAIRHTSGTTSVTLTQTGYYLVEFNATMVESGTAGNVQVKLLQDGTAVNGAVATASSTTATDLENLSFTTIVRVLPNCCSVPNNNPSVLSVANTGVGATITDISFTIVKIA